MRPHSSGALEVAPLIFPEDRPDHPEGSRHFVELEHELTGPQCFVGPIVQMARTPTAIAGPAPLLGGGGDQVLAELGAYAPDEIAALREAGVIGERSGRAVATRRAAPNWSRSRLAWLAGRSPLRAPLARACGRA